MSDDSMLTAEELRLRKRKRRTVFTLALVLVLSLTLGFFFGKPTVHAIKAFQARRHALKAFALIEQEKWKEARDEATAAYQLFPSEPEALRAVARFLTRVRNPEALEFWKHLRERTSLTRQDLRDEAAIALASDEMDRASAAVESLVAHDGKEATPADWFLAALLAQKRHASPDAQRFLQKVFDAPASTEREILQATLLELQFAGSSDDANARAQLQNDAWSRLAKLAQGKSAESLDALVLLAQREFGGTRAVASQESKGETALAPPSDLARAIDNHPLAKTPQKLIAVDLRMKETPAEKERLLAQAITQFKDADTPSLSVLATWLNGHGEFQRELDTIPLAKAVQSRDLFLQHLDALGALGRWDEIKQLLIREGFPLEPTVQNMYLARCAAQLGEITTAENSWKRALEAASGDAQKLLQLGDFAGKNGELDIAEAAYNSAAAQTPKLRMAQQGRLRVAQAKRDTKKMHAVLAEMLKNWPNDTAIQNDEAYTRLLLLGSSRRNDEAPASAVDGLRRGERNPKSEIPAVEAAVPAKGTDSSSGEPAAKFQPDAGDTPATTTEELIAIEKLAAELVRREPASLPHRTLLALTLLKQKRPVAALDVYNGINVSPQALTPSALAVHAAVLSANGQRDDARKEIQQAPLEKLLPEEQAGTANLRE
jgi:hypothetical protein